MNQRGFTIIEFSSVAVVFGVLALVIFTNIHKFTQVSVPKIYTITDRLTGKVYASDWYETNDDIIAFSVDGKTIRLSSGWELQTEVK